MAFALELTSRDLARLRFTGVGTVFICNRKTNEISTSERMNDGFMSLSDKQLFNRQEANTPSEEFELAANSLGAHIETHGGSF